MRLGDVILEMNAALLLKKKGGSVPLIVLHSALAQRKREARGLYHGYGSEKGAGEKEGIIEGNERGGCVCYHPQHVCV